jgi:hypothetical protein
METAVVQGLLALGPGGVMCWILLQQMKLDRSDRREDRAERLAYDKDRLETDKGLVRSLTALSLKIEGRPGDGHPS